MGTITRIDTWDNLPQIIKEKTADAPLFYSRDYEQHLLADNKVYYFYAGGFVLVVAIHTVAKVFRYGVFPCEPFIYLSDIPPYSEKDFLDDVVDELRRMKVQWTSITPASSFFMAYPDRSVRIPWGNYVIDLTIPEEELFKNVSSKHRNMIRRGEKSEIDVKFGGVELLSDYMILDKQTWERSGESPDNEPIFKKYLEDLPHNAFIGIAYKNSVPQCGLLGLYSKACFYYEFGSSAHKPEPGSTHYLQWKTILKMKSAGVLRYSFVGCRIDVDKDTKLSNIQHFKAGFGGELVRSFLFKCEMNRLQSKVFKLLMFARSGKYPQDAIDYEKSKWKELNQ